MLLRELANTSYPFTHIIDQHSSVYKTELFKFDDGNNEIEVAVDVTDEMKISEKIKPGFFEIMFRSRPKQKGDAINLSHSWTDLINDSGNAFKIFSTVLKIIKEVVKKNPNISTMLFAAKESEPSRVKLYSRFVDNIEKYLPGWKLKRVKPKSTVGFGIKNNTVYFLEKIS
jgi:hypothetical protein